jgi:hypothetical protein
MNSDRQQKRDKSRRLQQIYLGAMMVNSAAVSTWLSWKQNPGQGAEHLLVTFLLVAAGGSIAGITVYLVVSHFFDKK